MTESTTTLYILTFLSGFVLSAILTPAARSAALLLDVIDHPNSSVKTHRQPVPYLGGVAIFLAFTLSMLWIRVLTNFPTGTLRSLRGILIGGIFIFIVGMTDDIKFKGLHYKTKFALQIAAAVFVTLFGIRIRFIQPDWAAWGFTLFWIVGITNACNLTDIMDGLASSIIFVASIAFLLISLPTEEIYVNFAAAALAGSVLGFIPFNLSKKLKIFMGDSGSLFIGFVASALALGTSYTGETNLAVLAPILILALPIYDTILVACLRISRGLSPFLGSKDHVPLRLEILGWSRRQILLITVGMSVMFSMGAYLATLFRMKGVLTIYGFFSVILILFTLYILKAKIK